jgi:hypothetical protein
MGFRRRILSADSIAQSEWKLMPSELFRFFVSRLNGEIPLQTLFWRDMMLVGSVMNLSSMIGAIAYLANGGIAWIGAVIFLAPLPYNFFLIVSVFRTADLQAPNEAGTVKIAALVWLLVFVIM